MDTNKRCADFVHIHTQKKSRELFQQPLIHKESHHVCWKNNAMKMSAVPM